MAKKKKRVISRKLALLSLLTLSAITLSISTYLATNNTSDSKILAAASGTALRFYGNGRGDIDRVKIPVDPNNKIDVGAQDFTIEWWMKASSGDNRANTACNSGNDSWINGNVIIDRDIYFDGDFGDYGVSLMNGRVAFGVNNGSSGVTICAQTAVTDGAWHHVAVSRRRSDGFLWLFVDGRLEASVNGPDGDLSYRNGRSTNFPNTDPFLVLGAEKHDAGSAYPSYSGHMDELRISNSVRYTSAFTRPNALFPVDTNTIALYRFDEGSGTTITDSATSPVNGVMRVGGSPVGPVFVPSDLNFSTQPTPTIVPTLTPAPTIIPTIAPTPTVIPTINPTPTIVPTTTASPTATPTVGVNSALNFDGSNDRVSGASLPATGTKTVELYIRPSTNSQNSIVMGVANSQNGWTLELNDGRVAFWVGQSNNWQSVVSNTSLSANVWHHVAVTYDATSRQSFIFINGSREVSGNVGVIGSNSSLFIGGLSGYPFFSGELDEVRISNNVRYSDSFVRPAANLAVDGSTTALYKFNDSPGQRVFDSTGRYNLWRGGGSGVQSSDPTWLDSSANNSFR
jgi:Concanavalin A-like lectin/glucanases superfamily